jgi:hypothetical protein
LTKRKSDMKRKHLFIIIGQSIAILLVVVYAFVQQTLAKEAERRAMAAQQEAVKQRDAAEAARAEAEKQHLFAEQARMEADKQRLAAEDIYKKCQGKSR